MPGLQKMGGLAAIIEGLLFIIFPVFLFAILPAQGLGAPTGPNALADPVKVLPAAVNSPTVSIFGFLDVLVAVALCLVVLALHGPITSRFASGHANCNCLRVSGDRAVSRGWDGLFHQRIPTRQFIFSRPNQCCDSLPGR